MLDAAGEGRIVRAVFAGRPGHPVYLPWAVLEELEEFLAAGDPLTGAKHFLRSRADLLEVDCSDLASGRDVDVPTLDHRPAARHFTPGSLIE